jgi:hypothetical protein
MKHPVDTSQWGEFLLNDIATLTNGNKFDKNKMSHDNPSINFVSRTGFNNGISDFVDKIDGTKPYPAGAITLALGGSVGSTFVQPKPFYTGQNVGVIEFENKSDEMKQFVAVILNKVCSTQFSAFKNEINKHFKRDLSIPLPLKPSADPSNYSQDDIDWDYMETVMSRVTARAKERLANLPQPTDKKKTPVDTSSWGEFVVGELFECNTTKAFYPTKENLPEGETPYISRSTYDNGVSGHYNDINDEFTIHQKCITIGAETGIAFWQEKPFIPGVKVYTISHEQLNSKNALFVTTVLNKSADNYGFTQLRSMKKLKAESIKLPLKSSADLSNYTQEDIDWNYMENFMKTIETKAQTRLKTLQKTIA